MDFLQMARERIGAVPKVERDAHHVLHHKREWMTRDIGFDVRQRIVADGMSRVVHNLLHEHEAPVPVPEYHSLLRVYQSLPKRLGVFEAIDRYCVILEAANRTPQIKPIEIELNNLSILAVQNQLPYIRDGMGRQR